MRNRFQHLILARYILKFLIIECLNKTIDLVFGKIEKKCIRISKSGNAYWGNVAPNKVCFSKSSLKSAVKHLIENCFF